MRMRTTITFAFLAVLFAITVFGQQASTNQPTPPPQAKVEPCVTPAPPVLPKGVKPRLPKWIQDQIDRKRREIENKTGVSVPDPNAVIRDATAPKPCPSPVPVTQPKPQ